jgi:predicted alpha/beta hydrolase family esterase
VKRQVLFVQGGGPDVHDGWDVRLVESLRGELGPKYEVRYPRMPNEAEPDYDTWKAAIEKELSAMDDGAVLVGHSLGGTILINALAEGLPPRKLGAIFLVSAPFFGEGGWQADDLKSGRALGEKLPKDTPIHLYHGLADAEVPPSHAELYARAIPQARLWRVAGRDHQFNDDLSDVAAAIKSLLP